MEYATADTTMRAPGGVAADVNGPAASAGTLIPSLTPNTGACGELGFTGVSAGIYDIEYNDYRTRIPGETIALPVEASLSAGSCNVHYGDSRTRGVDRAIASDCAAANLLG